MDEQPSTSAPATDLPVAPPLPHVTQPTHLTMTVREMAAIPEPPPGAPVRRALVLSGGGSYGAFEVGALNVLCDPQYQIPDWDIICGVSVGAINGAFLAKYKLGQYAPQEAAQGLNALWMNLNTSKVYKPWCDCGSCNYLCACFHTSLYNTSPLEQYIRPQSDENAVNASGRLLKLGCAGIKSGSFVEFIYPPPPSQGNVDMVQAVLASAAFPVALEARRIGDDLYVDGGIRHIVPIMSALESGATDITIVSCSSQTYSEDPSWKDSNAVDIGLRVTALMSNQLIRNDIEVFKQYIAPARNITYRIIEPSLPLPQDPLDFDPVMIAQNIALGEKDARNVLNAELQARNQVPQ